MSNSSESTQTNAKQTDESSLQTGTSAGSQGSILNLTSLISLIVGLLGVSVSLYIFRASRPAPAMTIDQYGPVSYASTVGLHGLGEVTLTVGGRKINQVSAIPFSIRNTGNVPISSLRETQSYNMVAPIELEFVAEPAYRSSARLLALQSDANAATALSLAMSQTDSQVVRLNISYLNPGDALGFTVLLGDFGTPQIRVGQNPIIGGSLTTNLALSPLDEDGFSVFKRKTLPGIVGALLIAPLPVIFIALLVSVVRFLRVRRDRAHWDQYLQPTIDAHENAQKQKKDQEVTNRVEGLDQKLRRLLSQAFVEVPNSRFEKRVEKVNMLDILKSAIDERWNWVYENVQTPEIERLTNQRVELIIRGNRAPSSWGEITRKAFLLGFPALILAGIGVACCFLDPLDVLFKEDAWNNGS